MIPISDVNAILYFAFFVVGTIGLIALVLEYLYLKARKRIKYLEKQLAITGDSIKNSNSRTK